MGRRFAVPWPTRAGSVFFGDIASASKLSRANADGLIRRIGGSRSPSLYSADLQSDPGALVERNRWAIVAKYFPDAVIADRSAARDGLPSDGILSVVSNARATELSLPGLRVLPRPGAPLDDDPPWTHGLRITSDARTLVDNLALSRGRGHVARTLTRPEIEAWLVRKIGLRPPGWLSQLRDRAHEVAQELNVADRIELINDMIGQALGTRPVGPRTSPLLTAHVEGKAWDERRIEQFGHLTTYLANIPDLLDVPDHLPTPLGDLHGELPFYEAYFSNFIEGTEFSVEEARHIVSSGRVSPTRPEDAHDILGTFRVVSDPLGRAITPTSPDEFLGQLTARHSAVMVGRPDKNPGGFKTTANRVGSYTFVAPEHTEGTLTRGLSFLHRLPPGFARAAYMLFLISEVHPFDDGNGRLARVFMNAELSAVDQSRILVPIVWREEYMTALRVLSRDGRTDVYLRTLSHAWRWTAAMPWHDRSAVEGRLASTNALVDSTDAAREGLQLLLP